MKKSEMILFSPMENEILKLIKNERILSITTLSTIYYTNKTTPVNPRNVVASSIQKINIKCKRHKLPWFVNGDGVGRSGKRVWVDKLSSS